MRLFEPNLLQIAHRACVVVSCEGMLHGPAARAGGLGDVPKSDRLLGMGLYIGDGPAKCARRHRSRSTDLCRGHCGVREDCQCRRCQGREDLSPNQRERQSRVRCVDLPVDLVEGRLPVPGHGR
jgi:hypothetical protein